MKDVSKLKPVGNNILVEVVKATEDDNKTEGGIYIQPGVDTGVGQTIAVTLIGIGELSDANSKLNIGDVLVIGMFAGVTIDSYSKNQTYKMITYNDVLGVIQEASNE